MSPYSKINPRDTPWLVKIKASPQALCSNVIDNEHMLHNTYAKGHTVINLIQVGIKKQPPKQ